MSGQQHQGVGSVPDRWDRVFEALGSAPRRRLLYSLSQAPVGEGVLVPVDQGDSDEGQSVRRQKVAFRHVHLPKLADAGYVRWESDPLRVYRGRHFEEVNAVGRAIIDALPDYPARLRSSCGLLPGE